MKFIENVEKKRYQDFCDNFFNNHFCQSYEFGQSTIVGKGQTPIYVGLEDDNNVLVAAALLLKKSTPFNMCYFYSPRGFLIDFENTELLTLFTKEIKAYLKRNKAIYLKIDPEIMYQENDINAHPLPSGKNNFAIFNNLIDLGYRHKGFNKLYEGNQPRYTFRTCLNKSLSEIENNCSKTFLKSIKRSYFYELEITESDDIEKFWELNKLIAKKDGFTEYSIDYYKTIYKEFKEADHIKILNAKIYPDLIIKKCENELEKNEDNEEKITRLKKDLETLLPLKDKYPTGLVIASLITLYTSNRAWTMYIGNDNIGQYTFAGSRLYYESMIDAHNRKLEFWDLFGVCGDPHTKYKNLANIYDFKRKLGGELIEFIGEFDLVNKPFWYKLLPILLSIYRKLRRK